MNTERWQRCKEIFHAALELPPSERDAYLQVASGGDEAVRREVASLLESEEQSNEFLSEGAADYLGGAFADTPPDTSLPAGEVLAGRYRILRLIGRGGMGEVYEAEDLELHASIALKVVRPEIAAQREILDRFKREVHLARQVTHPNVCRIFDLGHHSGGPAARITFLTMEMLSGETLADRVARTGAITTAEALPMVLQLIAGLTAAHRAGIIHRDFKSGNVILAGDSAGNAGGAGLQAKIMDFGLARAMSGGEHVTIAGRLVGTPAYMAPEQIEGGEITAATDIYALGVVMYEMVTGVLPFTGESAWIVATKRLREPPPSPRAHVPDLDRRWEAAILRCLERNPAARFQNAGEIGAALRGESAPEVLGQRTIKAAARRFGMRPIRTAAWALALVVALSAGYYLLDRFFRRSTPGQYGWHLVSLPSDPSLPLVAAVSGSLDPMQLVLFGPSFARAWVPGQNLAPPLTIPFSAGAQAECTAGLWIIHDDNRHLTRWDPAKQQPVATIALPLAIRSAACLDDKATRWGFLTDGPSPRWIEFDAKTNRTIRTIPLDDVYLKATLDPTKRLLVLIAVSRISVRTVDTLEEIYADSLGEKLIGLWASGWSETGRYFSLGFKQLAIYDFAAKRRVHTLATTGWTAEIGWLGDDGISVMDDRGRFYWTSDISKDWQFKQEPPAPGVYRSFWIPSHYRWIAFGAAGGGLVWEYVTPPLLFDLPVSQLEIWSVAASPDGSKLAVAGKDSRIFIVDPEKKKTVQVLEGHSDGITFIRFAQPNRLISASDDKTIRLWDTASGKLLRTVAGHESLVNAFGISPDGQWLVSVSSDSKVKLWKLPEMVYVKDIGTTATGGAAAAFLNDGTHLLVSDWKGNLTTYDGPLPSLSMRQRFQLSKGAVYMLCPSKSAWWAVVREGERAGLWLVPASDITQAVQVTRGAAYYCSTSSDGQLTAVQYPNRIEVRSNADGKVAATYRYSGRDGAAVAIGDHPTTVVAGFADGHLLAWPMAAR